MTPEEWRNRPTTFGLPRDKNEVEHYWDWEQAILDAVAVQDAWMAHKFTAKLNEHKRKYPAFKPERVAEMFIKVPPKVRAAYCYQPIQSFTKVIHKAASTRSQAFSQD